MRMVTVLLLAIAPATLRAAEGEADGSPPPPACADAACAVDATSSLLDEGRPEEAAAYAAEQVDRFPDAGPLQILLGVAQLRSADPLWAVDTFSRRLEQNPEDCEARTWLAWAWLQLAAVEEALAVVEDGGCGGRDPWAARVRLLQAVAERSRGDDAAARERLEAARGRDEAFAEDREAIRGLTRALVPDRLDELAWRIAVANGCTTNALLGSPTDPSLSAGDPASQLVTTDVWLRFAPDFGFWLKPAIELMPKLQVFAFESVREQSYLDLSGRVGVYLDWDVPRILLAYRPSYLLLFAPDGAGSPTTWYYSAHRAEVEVEITPWLMAFAGAGRREFFEMGRSRTELDGGLGGNVEVVDRLSILWTVSGRGLWAQDPAYDVGGVTGSLNVQYRWDEGLSARAGVTVAGDWYPDSQGAAAFGEPDAARADLFLRAGYQMWTPSFSGLRLGLSYDYSFRDSTVPAYDFDDHRVLLRIAWSGNADLVSPSVSDAAPTADLDWGFGPGESALVERVQDILREEEQVYRSCGCAE